MKNVTWITRWIALVTVASVLPSRENVMELWTVLMAKMNRWNYVVNLTKVLIAESFYVWYTILEEVFTDKTLLCCLYVVMPHTHTWKG